MLLVVLKCKALTMYLPFLVFYAGNDKIGMTSFAGCTGMCGFNHVFCSYDAFTWRMI